MAEDTAPKPVRPRTGTEARPTAEAALEALQAFRIIVRSVQRHSQRIERKFGVSGAQLWALQEIAEADGVRVGELARRMAVHQSTASNILDRLEEKGLVRRARTTEDQRVVRLYLTDPGRGLLAQAPSPTRGVLPHALRSMSGESLAELTLALKNVLVRISDADPSSGLVPLSFTE